MAGDAGPGRHVLEPPVRRLAVEAIPESRGALVGHARGRHVAVERGAVGEEHVEAPVAVVIQQRHAAAHGLGEELHGGLRGRMTEVDAAAWRDVGEARRLLRNARGTQ